MDSMSSNATSNLPDEFIFLSTLFREPASVRFASFFLVLIIYLTAVVGNSLISLVVLRDHQLHKPMYVFIAALSVTDIVESTTTVPRILYDFFSDNLISLPSCFTQVFFYHVSLRDQGYILAIMSVDRYLAVCRPLQYASLMPLSTAGKALGLTFLLATAQGVGYVVQVTNLDFCKPKVILSSNCDNLVVINMSCTRLLANVIYSYVNVLSGVVAPIVLILLMYALILRECYKPSMQGGRRRRATETCSTHLIVISLYFGSIFFTIASGFQMFAHLSREVRAPFQTMHFMLPPALNPIIYGLKTNEIRRSVLRFLQRQPRAVADGKGDGD